MDADSLGAREKTGVLFEGRKPYERSPIEPKGWNPVTDAQLCTWRRSRNCFAQLCQSSAHVVWQGREIGVDRCLITARGTFLCRRPFHGLNSNTTSSLSNPAAEHVAW